MRKGVPKPTRSELEILGVLSEKGPSTVREVHEAISGRRNAGYTGILKLLQIMTTKGLVVRDESQRTHVYAARELPKQTKRRIVDELLQQVFQGSASQMMLHALAGRPAPQHEIDELRRILDECEQRGRTGEAD
jgi:BlaI family transcriptional regulator, penicillinase repressor